MGKGGTGLGHKYHQPCHRHRPSAFSHSVNQSNFGHLSFGCELLSQFALIQDLKETSTRLLDIHYVYRQLQGRLPN